MVKRKFWLGAAFIIVATQAVAQTAVQDLEARLGTDQGRAAAPLDAPEIQFTSQRPPVNSDEIVFRLNDIEVAGATAFGAAELRPLYEANLGGEVALTRIYEIAGLIQGLYRDSDFIFTRVVVPAQEIDGGVVRIEVIEAVITNVSVEEPDKPIGPVRALVERMLAPIVGLANPTGAVIERALLNVNELPGITRATAIPQADPDNARGGLQLFVNVERDPAEGALYADTRQTPGIGRGLAGATLTLNSYSEWADTTTIAVFNSFDVQSDVADPNTGRKDGAFDFDERTTVQVTHQRAVGTDGAYVRGQALFSRTRPNDNLAPIGIEGEQIFGSAEFGYPIVRTRQVQLVGAIGAEFFNSETDVSNGQLRVADDRIRVARASLEGLARDPVGYTSFEVSFRQGLDILNATDANAQDKSRQDGDSTFSLLRGNVDRLVVFNERLSLFGRVAGQYAFDPLLASEEFAIGGATFGRGYDPSENTGDHGLGLSLEVRYLTDFDIEGYPLTMETYAFAEAGFVWNKGQGLPKNQDVASYGGGVRLFLPDDYFLGFEVAVPADGPLQRVNDKNQQVDGPRFFVNFQKRL